MVHAAVNFTLHKEPATWADAYAACSAVPGGSLASFHSLEEYMVLQPLLELAPSAWIGLSASQPSSLSQANAWVDGTPVDFEFWNPGYPNATAGTKQPDGVTGACTIVDGSARVYLGGPKVGPSCSFFVHASFGKR